LAKQLTEKNFYIVADSEDLKSISELRKWGLPVVEAKKGPDSVRFGVNKLLQYNLFLHVDSINLQNEVRNYVRTTDKEGNVIDVFVKKKDHIIDSIRYPIVTFKV
jgi:phage terminase large subunit